MLYIGTWVGRKVLINPNCSIIHCSRLTWQNAITLCGHLLDGAPQRGKGCGNNFIYIPVGLSLSYISWPWWFNCFLSSVSLHSVWARLPFVCSLVMELSPGALVSPCGAWLLSIPPGQNCQRSRQRWETPWWPSTGTSTPRLVMFHACRRWCSGFEFPCLSGRRRCAAQCGFLLTAARGGERRENAVVLRITIIIMLKKKILNDFVWGAIRILPKARHSSLNYLWAVTMLELFVSGLLWLPTLNNYNSPHSVINVECGSNGSAKSTNQTSIFTQGLYCSGLQTSLSMKSIWIPECKIDGEQLSNGNVFRDTNMFLYVTGVNRAVRFWILTLNPCV